MITVIRNAGTLIAWDGAAHAYMPGADLAFDNGTITFVGRGYTGSFDTEIDAAGLMVMPGLVNIHTHPSSEPINKGLLDEIGSPGLYNSSLYEYMPLFRGDPASIPHAVRVAYSELLLSGVTTVADLSIAHPDWLALAAESGLRICLAPMFKSAKWSTRNGHVVDYEWDEPAGEQAMADALNLIDRAIQHECGRLSGMVIPAQIDTCSAALIQASFAEAERRNLPWQIHAAQSVVEFHEITRRHGVTPIAWLDQLGVLGDRSIIGHAIFLDDHPSTPWHTKTDLARLAATGTTVAHCPTVFARRGIALRDAGRYRRAGVNLGVGTDTYPHDMLAELRLLAYLARTQAGDPRTLDSTDLFTAATINGAKALRRTDIGRLAPGCRADIVMVDLSHPAMLPGRDPIRSLIYAAGDRAITRVIVDGHTVVEQGRVLTMDYPASAAALHEAQRRAIERAPALDWANRPVDRIAPPTFSTI